MTAHEPYCWFSQDKSDLAHVWDDPWMKRSRRLTVCGISIAPKDFGSPFYEHFEQPRGGSCSRCIEYVEKQTRLKKEAGPTAAELLIEGAQIAGPSGSRNWNHRHWQEKALQLVKKLTAEGYFDDPRD